MFIIVEVVVNIYHQLILNYQQSHGKYQCMYTLFLYMYFSTPFSLHSLLSLSLSLSFSSPYSVIGHCRQCKELDNKARAREDYTLYRAMLKTIRKTEENYQDDSHIIFIIQVMDYRGIVMRGTKIMHNTLVK